MLIVELSVCYHEIDSSFNHIATLMYICIIIDEKCYMIVCSTTHPNDSCADNKI